MLVVASHHLAVFPVVEGGYASAQGDLFLAFVGRGQVI